MAGRSSGGRSSGGGFFSSRSSSGRSSSSFSSSRSYSSGSSSNHFSSSSHSHFSGNSSSDIWSLLGGLALGSVINRQRTVDTSTVVHKEQVQTIMTIYYCDYCGSKYKEFQQKCSNCGAQLLDKQVNKITHPGEVRSVVGASGTPNQKQTATKTSGAVKAISVFIFLIFVLPFIISFCSAFLNTVNDNYDFSDSYPSGVATSTSYCQMGEVISTKWFDLTVLSYERLNKYNGMTAQSGYEYVKVYFTVTNTTKDMFFVFWDDFSLRNPTEYFSYPTSGDISVFPDYYELGIGASRTGCLMFLLPKSSNNLYFYYVEVDYNYNYNGEYYILLD